MSGWNHNIHYHHILLRAVPPVCVRALDVGCGEGQLARELAGHCQEVFAIDADRATVLRARAASETQTRVSFIEGDVMSYPFCADSFDLIAAVASLHHLPLRPAIERFRSLLKSGGVLAVIGLYRLDTIIDFANAAAAVPASWILRRLHSFAKIEAPIQKPKDTLCEIRAAFHSLLPGGTFCRHLLFRYSYVWRKP
jgi:SAM-dependent methyltransferase